MKIPKPDSEGNERNVKNKQNIDRQIKRVERQKQKVNKGINRTQAGIKKKGRYKGRILLESRKA